MDRAPPVKLLSARSRLVLPHRDAPPPSAGFTVAVPPVARTLGELADRLGRDAEAIAER
ncbi:hypothetical protein ACWDYJ_02695 [Streptomyces sp. NPDC003042]